MSAQGTPDDSVWCRICDPPYETSVAMLTIHFQRVHGWTDDDLEALKNAPIIDGDTGEELS